MPLVMLLHSTMMKHRVRGAALVEYASILVCVGGLAGGGMKVMAAKTGSTAALATAGLSGTSASAGSGSSGSKGGSSATSSKGGGGGAASKPKKPKAKGPRELGSDDDTV